MKGNDFNFYIGLLLIIVGIYLFHKNSSSQQSDIKNYSCPNFKTNLDISDSNHIGIYKNDLNTKTLNLLNNEKCF